MFWKVGSARRAAYSARRRAAEGVVGSDQGLEVADVAVGLGHLAGRDGDQGEAGEGPGAHGLGAGLEGLGRGGRRQLLGGAVELAEGFGERVCVTLADQAFGLLDEVGAGDELGVHVLGRRSEQGVVGGLDRFTLHQEFLAHEVGAIADRLGGHDVGQGVDGSFERGVSLGVITASGLVLGAGDGGVDFGVKGLVLLGEGVDRGGGRGGRCGRGGRVDRGGRRGGGSGGLLGGLLLREKNAGAKLLGAVVGRVELEQRLGLLEGGLELALVPELDGLAEQLDRLKGAVAGLADKGARDRSQYDGGQGEARA